MSRFDRFLAVVTNVAVGAGLVVLTYLIVVLAFAVVWSTR